ncbi:Gfo/Idh/MocA family protein [Engelhardtia mirabilis]|uniref:Oxidoreductase family, NAD-binding Rossmann fold n=1 Tax=Engelhardtia mirabilis TaxID=2528011 RepID=A0A518BLV3_9BACT|nr:Oxidoreductase family, NAD-binding Rossmann fold [Planctomycetes bacterium Pla133]QDV02288.1 Oxidoreductase family, NAD-binding Rossmann fold [Planctomycetes bacterium Pla86]
MQPLKIALLGLVHGHVDWVLDSARLRDDIELVGVAEHDQALFRRLTSKYGFGDLPRTDEAAELLERTKPDAVVVMTDIVGHRAALAAAADAGLAALVERPLDFDLDHALSLARVARERELSILTHYETAHYPAIRAAADHLHSGDLGELSRLRIRAGHQGPAALGCAPSFLKWLLDSERGGGAMVDFACFGVHLALWLVGRPPQRVTASTQSIWPEEHRGVDDQATLLLDFDRVQAVVEASWCWPNPVKDVELIGSSGFLRTGRAGTYEIGEMDLGGPSARHTAPPLSGSLTDAWTQLAAVARGAVPDPLYGLDLSLGVASVLEAARQSAREGVSVTPRPWG